MDIEAIIQAIRGNKVRITDHADEEAQADRLSFEEVYFSVFQGEVIEEYVTDKPFPSCLIYGSTFGGDPYSVWAYNQESGWAVLITVYRPDPNRWVGWRTRRSRNDAV